MPVIYALRCPETGTIRYIGKANDPVRRLKQHLRDCYRGQSAKDEWLRFLRSTGQTPKLDVLRTVSEADWEASEQAVISEIGIGNLLNAASGGVPKWIDRGKSGRTLHAKVIGRLVTLGLSSLADGYRCLRQSALKAGQEDEYEAHLMATFGSAL